MGCQQTGIHNDESEEIGMANTDWIAGSELRAECRRHLTLVGIEHQHEYAFLA